MIPDHEHELAALSKALAHPIRVHLFRRLLRAGEASVGDLVRQTGLPQATVSQHLAQLRQAGLVRVTAQERRHVHHVCPSALRRLTVLVGGLAAVLPREAPGPAPR